MNTAALINADFVVPPFDHQMAEFERYCDAPARALGWTMRTGKSKATIDKACHNYYRGKIDGVLIFAPNGVHANWAEVEFPKHTWKGLDYSALVWRSRDNSVKAHKKLSKAERAKWVKARADWYEQLKAANGTNTLMVLTVNSESMIRDDVRRAVAHFIKHRRVFLVVDESDDFGTPGSKRTKMIRALARRCPMRQILSGTIVTGSPLAAWSQYEVLKPGALGFDDYEEFKKHIAVFEDIEIPGRQFPVPKLVGFQNLDDLRARMAQWTSVVLREDCADMPALQLERRTIEPSEEQRRVYRDLHDTFMSEIDGTEMTIGERCSKLQKLQQVFSGFVFDVDKELHIIPGANPRLDALLEEVYHAPGKVIIWCNFQPDMDLVKERLLFDGYKPVEYHGRISDKKKAEALRRFREDKDVKPFIGHPQSGGRGLDMSAASTIIWYSHTFKARIRAQAMERATAIGGGNIRVVDFVAPGPDSYILKTTNDRVDIADHVAGVGMKNFLKGLAL